jgi:transposase
LTYQTNNNVNCQLHSTTEEVNLGPVKLVKIFGNKRQAALALKVSRQTIYDWLEKGRIPDSRLEQISRAIEKRQAKLNGYHKD